MERGNLCLYEKTIRYIAEIILANIDKPGYKLPTEAELSKALNVSRITATTAYRAVNETGAIVRIQSKGSFIAAGANAEKVKSLLGAEQTERVIKIGVILPSARSRHVMDILSGILEKTKNYRTIVATTDMSQSLEQAQIRDMLKENVDGLIIYPVDEDHYNSSLLNLAVNNFPVVLADRYLHGLDFCCALSDNADMAEKSTELLISHGNRDILFFHANESVPSSIAARRDGYIATLQKHGVSAYHVYQYEAKCKESVAENFAKFMQSRPQITAAVTADYKSGKLFSQYLRERNVGTPQDMEVVYIDFDEEDACPYGKTPTYIRQDSRKIGEAAAEMMIEKIRSPHSPVQTVYIPAKLIRGNSTR